jgi:hypothetical protein
LTFQVQVASASLAPGKKGVPVVEPLSSFVDRYFMIE